MKPVTTGDKITGKLANFAVVAIGEAWLVAGQVERSHFLGLENDLAARFQPSVYEIPDDLGLAINRDRLTAGEARQIDP